MDDAHHVEPNVRPESTADHHGALFGQVTGCEPPQPCRLGATDRLRRPPESGGRPRFYFTEHQHVTVARDDVYLALGAAPVASEKGQPAAMQVVGGELLAVPTDRVLRVHGPSLAGRRCTRDASGRTV